MTKLKLTYKQENNKTNSALLYKINFNIYCNENKWQYYFYVKYFKEQLNHLYLALALWNNNKNMIQIETYL